MKILKLMQLNNTGIAIPLNELSSANSNDLGKRSEDTYFFWQLLRNWCIILILLQWTCQQQISLIFALPFINSIEK